MTKIIKSSSDSYYLIQSTKTEDLKKAHPVYQQYLMRIYTSDSELYECTTEAINQLLKTILEREINNNGLYTIFKQIESRLTSSDDEERVRSILFLSLLLEHQRELNNKVNIVNLIL